MSGYLQRLIDRATPIPTAGIGEAMPAHAVASPLAAQDQRLNDPALAAMLLSTSPGAEVMADGDLEPMDTLGAPRPFAPRPAALPIGAPPRLPPPPFAVPPMVDRPLPRRNDGPPEIAERAEQRTIVQPTEPAPWSPEPKNEPPSPSHFSLPQSDITAVASPVSPQPAPARPVEPIPAVDAALARRIVEATPVPRTSPPVREEARHDFEPARSPAVTAIEAPERVSQHETRAAAAPPAPIVQVEPPPLPLPPIPPAPTALPAPAAQPAEDKRTSERAAPPQMARRQERRDDRTPPVAQVVTAEAASLIGPLSRRRRTVTLFGMRRR